ncbi:polysaccharide pyruvyl transferase family protein [Oxalicibacterium solurbis]|nr:polysaccharide pyruvyl transferase family protein [Oxalicibacterium solurbis]
MPAARKTIFNERGKSHLTRDEKSMANDLKNALLLNDTSAWYHWGCTATSRGVGDALRDSGWNITPIPILETYGIKLSPTEWSAQNGTQATETDVLDDDAYFAEFSVANPQWIRRFKETNAIIINGEGTLHGMKPHSSGLLYLAYIAKTRFGLPVSIINHSVYPQSDGTFEAQGRAESFYTKIYRVLDHIAVRETRSLENCKKMGCDATLAFDCMPLTLKRHFDFSNTKRKNTLLLSGCVSFSDQMIKLYTDIIGYANRKGIEVEFLIGAADHFSLDDKAFVNQLSTCNIGKWRLIQATSLDSWFQTIAEASLLISGRFHHTIAALCLGTPFIVMESNTPKISGMLETLGCNPALSGFDPQFKGKAFALFEDSFGKEEDARFHQLAELAEKNFSLLNWH